MPSPVVAGCGRCLRWFPLLFIIGAVAWSYYAYVVRLCFGLTPGPSLAEKVIYLIFYHIVLAMFMWAYGKVTFTKPAAAPQMFYLPDGTVAEYCGAATDQERAAVLETFAKDLPLVCRGKGNGIRYCEKCLCIKPDRSHHCSTCGMCVLKMDHHCPWVNNCVGFSTYKYFLLFLFYAQLYCIYVAATDMQYFLLFWTSLGSTNGANQSDFHVMFVFIIALMFGLAVLALFGYHIHLICTNNSTVESLHAPILHGRPVKNAFNMGAKQNLLEVFGDRAALWFLPVWSSKGDGIHFANRCDLTPAQATSYDTHGLAVISLQGDGHVTQPLTKQGANTYKVA